VFTVSAFALGELRQQGHILSLDPFIEQGASLDLVDFYPATVEILTSEGKLWAVPAGVDVQVMYYNQDLFDQYDVPYPEMGWTWDDFLNRALAMRDPDAGIFGYTTTTGYFDTLLFVHQHGGRIVDDLQDPTRMTFDDPLTVEALEWYARLFHVHQVAPTPQQARRAFGGGQYAFYEGLRHGKVGMWIGSLSERGGLTWPVEWFVNWGMVPPPRGAQSATAAWVEGYAISSHTQHPDACWQWILFLSEQTTYRLMPARRSLAESTAYEGRVGDEVAAVARASMENAVVVSPRIWTDYGPATRIFERAVGRILDGDATPQEAMDWAQRQVESTEQE
jgi:multiple sugar transport system substrate-binding protein